MQKDLKDYWASASSKDISDSILQKVDDYYKFLTASGRIDLYKRSFSYYYRPLMSGGRMNPVGEQGELSAISINHYRNLLLHLETMTVQQRASYEPRATNSDVKSQSQVILAAGLLDYYSREKRMERNIVQAVKDGLILSEGFVRVEWEAQGGKEYGKTETGATIYEGDVKYTNYSTMDVIRDFTLTTPANNCYYILRDYKNKYNLAAQFPELSDDILSDSDDMLKRFFSTNLSTIGIEESDNIAQYTLLHEPTPILPQGRYTVVLDNGTVLMDGPLPYKHTHVYRLAPDEQTGSIFGYTVGFDLLPMQEAIDILYSTAITNQSTFGVQNILIPKGSDLSTSQLSGGLNVMEYDPKVGKPEPMNLTATPPEIFNFMSQLEQLMETISGVNSVARGNPEASLKSGAALALVQSMAIQFSMSLQRSYSQLLEDIGTATIQILQDFASVPRIAVISGKSNRPLMKEFTGLDLGDIQRVHVDMGNALTRTTAGKVNLAEALLQNGMVENPDQYIQVVTTGRLEPVIEGKQSQLLLIKGENEMLAEGKPQRALVTDNHAKHILEHTIVLNNPEIRMDPNNPIVQVTLDHIQEHLGMLQNPNVQPLLQILHQEQLAQPPPPQGMPMDGGTGEMLDPTQPVQQQAQDVNMPNMPSPPQGADPMSQQLIEGMQA